MNPKQGYLYLSTGFSFSAFNEFTKVYMGDEVDEYWNIPMTYYLKKLKPVTVKVYVHEKQTDTFPRYPGKIDKKTEKKYILQLPEKNDWNKSKTARDLNMTYHGLHKKMQRLDIERERKTKIIPIWA